MDSKLKFSGNPENAAQHPHGYTPVHWIDKEKDNGYRNALK